jgi:hypothetical protein
MWPQPHAISREDGVVKGLGSSEKRRIVQIGAVAVATLAVVAAAVWVVRAVFIVPKGDGYTRQSSIDPAQESTTGAIPSDSTSRSAELTSGASGSGLASTTPGAGSPSAKFVRATKIAYLLDGVVYVAEEDGTDPVKVGRSNGGPYALSPDGRTVALVSDMRLVLIDVTTAVRTDVCTAIEEAQVWSPDSSRVMFVRRDAKGSAQTSVWSVERRGTGLRKLHRGRDVAVSPDGRTVVLLDFATVQAAQGVAAQLFVSRDGSAFSPLSMAAGFVSAVAVGNERIYFGVLGPQGEASIESAAFDGSAVQPVFGAPSAAARATWGALQLSPGGAHLAAVATGDDGYSRLNILRLGGASVVKPDSRRDAYARSWSADGKYLYYVEGNAFQGQPTTLYRVERDGTGRKALVVGGR